MKYLIRMVLSLLIIITGFTSTGCTTIGWGMGRNIDNRRTEAMAQPLNFDNDHFVIGGFVVMKTSKGDIHKGVITQINLDEFVILSYAGLTRKVSLQEIVWIYYGDPPINARVSLGILGMLIDGVIWIVILSYIANIKSGLNALGSTS